MISQIDEWFRLYRQELVRWVAGFIGCRETAQDLVQESYLILARQAAAGGVEKPRGFLYRTAKNLALDHLRHRRIVDQHASEAKLRQDETAWSAEHAVTAGRQVERFAEILAGLPPVSREVFCAVRLDGLSYREAAKRLGLSERQVERHLFRALLACRACRDDD